MPKDPTVEEAEAHKRARPKARQTEPPMTLGNMRENGVHSLFVSCDCCHHSVELNVDHMPDVDAARSKRAILLRRHARPGLICAIPAVFNVPPLTVRDMPDQDKRHRSSNK
jgi:hypothetical protein